MKDRIPTNLRSCRHRSAHFFRARRSTPTHIGGCGLWAAHRTGAVPLLIPAILILPRGRARLSERAASGISKQCKKEISARSERRALPIGDGRMGIAVLDRLLLATFTVLSLMLLFCSSQVAHAQAVAVTLSLDTNR